MNNKVEEFFNGFKLGELLHRDELSKEKEKNNMLCTIITVFAVIAVIVATVLIAYKFLKRRPIEEFEYDFDDDFDDSFSMDSLDSELEDEEYPQAAIIEE